MNINHQPSIGMHPEQYGEQGKTVEDWKEEFRELPPIDYEKAEQRAEDIWLFLVGQPDAEEKTISKKVFMHEVAAMLTSTAQYCRKKYQQPRSQAEPIPLTELKEEGFLAVLLENESICKNEPDEEVMFPGMTKKQAVLETYEDLIAIYKSGLSSSQPSAPQDSIKGELKKWASGWGHKDVYKTIDFILKHYTLIPNEQSVS